MQTRRDAMREIKKKYTPSGHTILPLSERISARLGIRGIRIVKMPASRARELYREQIRKYGQTYSGFGEKLARRAMPPGLVLVSLEKRETKLPDTYFWVQFRKRRRLAR
jgi:hypothetical protein